MITVLLVLFGVPAIAGLALTAWRRARLLRERITQVQEEMARDPRPPYAALADLMQEQESQNKGK